MKGQERWYKKYFAIIVFFRDLSQDTIGSCNLPAMNREVKNGYLILLYFKLRCLILLLFTLMHDYGKNTTQ